jgi:hypothetical protein
MVRQALQLIAVPPEASSNGTTGNLRMGGVPELPVRAIMSQGRNADFQKYT